MAVSRPIFRRFPAIWRSMKASDDLIANVGRILATLSPVVVFALSCFVRLSHTLSAEFPLGDGGLFYQMVAILQQAHYHLPVSVAYNGRDLPFAYPPFGFYATGLLADLTGMSTLNVLRFFPLVVSMATVAAMAGLTRSVLQTRTQAIVAIFAFGMLPLSYRYFIMGAGITRAPGLLFAILAIWLSYLLCTQQQMRYVIPTMLTAALTIISHPNATWFMAYSLALVIVFFGRHRRTIFNMSIVAIGAFVLTAPWWAVVVGRHGLTPFLAASQSNNPGIPGWQLLLQFTITDEPLFPFLALGGLLGVLVCLRDQRWWPPVWLVAACVLDTRYTGSFAMVPLALLVGIGLDGLVNAIQTRPLPVGRISRVALSCLLSWVAFSVFIGSTALPGPALRALPEAQIEAMRWVAANTSEESTFVVVAPFGVSAGSESEWFPVLTGRINLGVYQGSEWLPRRIGPSRWERYDQLQRCGAEEFGCIEQWATQEGAEFAYVYVREAGTQTLRSSLLASTKYSLVYHVPDVWIFARRITG